MMNPDKKKPPKCKHNIQKYDCHECSHNICKHDKVLSRCVDCCGGSTCIHKKQRSTCKKCGGGAYCKHDKRRSVCKECGGGSICEHNKKRAVCKECCGNSICKHQRERSRCKECQGGSICEHNKLRSRCKECQGGSICEHNKLKYQCKNCNGNGICEHNKLKTQCKECKGSSICEHNKNRSICRECGGSSICEHNKIKQHCIKCTKDVACQNCFDIYVDRRTRFKPYCFRCYCILNPEVDIQRRYKLKEHHMKDEIKKEFPGVKIVFDKKIDKGCSVRRPDVRIECLTHTIIIECDENQHKNVSCEDKRTMELFQDLGNRPIVMIRFNPDKYDGVDGCFKFTKTGSLSLIKKEWNTRMSQLIDKISYYMNNIPEKEVSIEYMFYNTI